MSEQEPIVKLEPGGKAAVLSYDVPERTAHAGRNLIALKIPQDWFRPPSQPAPPKPPAALLVRSEPGPGAVADGAGRRYSVITPRGVFHVPEHGEEVPPESDTTRLLPLTARSVEAVVEAGHAPQFWETLSGDLALRDVRLAMAVQQNPDSGDVPTGGGGGKPPLVYSVKVTSPSDGASITGQLPGVDVPVTGTAAVTSGFGSITAVDIRVGAGDFKPVTPSAPGNFGTWSATVRLTASGLTTITVRATHSGGGSKLTEFTLNANLQAAPVTDTQPPQLSIDAPADNKVVVAPDGGTMVEVTGKASDDKSLKEVTVGVDDRSPVVATLAADGKWTASVAVTGVGVHTLRARAVDATGNAAVAKRSVVLSLTEPVEVVSERLMLVESYRLTSFSYRYGAGETLHALSLAPGEVSTISVRSYRHDRQLEKKASTIFEQTNTESSVDFQTTVTNEQAYKNTYDESWEWNVRGEVQATWGWGSASVDGGVAGGTQAAREEFAKNIKTAVQKHASKASAQRTVQVTSSTETEREEGVEEAVTREIRNINLSRTLSLVMRRLNREVLSALHLVDLRVAIVRLERVGEELRTAYQEVTLPQLDALIRDRIIDTRQEEVRQLVRSQLEYVWDFQDKPVRFVEEVPLTNAEGKPIPGTEYLRVRRNLWSTWVLDPATNDKRQLPGVITAVASNVMRTDAVIAEALLGQGDGLDAYSHGLQNVSVQSEQAALAAAKADVERSKLAIDLVKAKDADGAKIYEQIYGNGRASNSIARLESHGGDPVSVAENGHTD